MWRVKVLLIALGIVGVLSACNAGGSAATPTSAPATPTVMSEAATSTPAPINASATPTPTSASASATEAPATQAASTNSQSAAGTTPVSTQVAAGHEEYDDNCSSCHGMQLQGISGPALNRSNILKYGTADQLESFIASNMPLGAAGSLTQNEYYEITAYILDQDSLLPPGVTLSSQTAGSINLQQLATQTPAPEVKTPPASPTPAGALEVELAYVPDLGNYLTNPNGEALYFYDKDKPGVSNCTGHACTDLFPPLTVTAGTQPTAGSNVPGKLGVIQRPDGSYQVTYTNLPAYDNVPLYTYFGDYIPGQINGDMYNGEWHLLVVSSSSAGASSATATPASIGSQENAALGAPIYLENCTSCHGIEGEGVDAPPLRNSQYIQNSSDQDIYGTIANGRRHTEMPAWLQGNGGPLTKAEIYNVIGYLETLQNVSPMPSATPGPPEPTEAPQPTGGPTPEPAQPSFSGGPGQAASMTGDSSKGRPEFGMYCASCHGPEGVQGIPNPGSDDGSVPPLNPIDPTIANPDPKVFAKNVDLFIQHGSIPEGPSPMILMPSFGDSNMLTQQQIADIIAYVISLNGGQ
jgi:mono/diheme cytochrome c family protein